MSWSLFDGQGRRKYLSASERKAFIRSAIRTGGDTGLFCLTLVLTGARISEVLQLTAQRIDASAGALVFETLKRRKRGIFRAVPVPTQLIERIQETSKADVGKPRDDSSRIWRWGRTTAWKRVKCVMYQAGITGALATPRALRHTFGVQAVQDKIALSLIKKWLGHAKVETTAIYTDPIGTEERALARLMWPDFLAASTTAARINSTTSKSSRSTSTRVAT